MKILMYKKDGNNLKEVNITNYTEVLKDKILLMDSDDKYNDCKIVVLVYNNKGFAVNSVYNYSSQKISSDVFLNYYENYISGLLNSTYCINKLNIELLKHNNIDVNNIIKRNKEIIENNEKENQEKQRKEQEQREQEKKQEKERLEKEFNKFYNDEYISGVDFIKLCKSKEVKLHPRTTGMILNQSKILISKNDGIRTWSSKKLNLDKVFIAISEL